MPDITSLLKSANIDLERTTTSLFGAAVERFSSTRLSSNLPAVFGTSDFVQNNPNDDGEDSEWIASDYAAGLANAQFRPKLKFMFRVEFLIKPEILAQFSMESATWKNNFAFMIKSVDRPKVDFEYEEVNLYNFRTKILKQIKHRELTISFMDDVGNNVHEFFRFMMMVHSPITRRSIGASQDITEAVARYSAGNGMVFSRNLGTTTDFATRGVMETDVGNAIQAIKITQIFAKPGGPTDLSTTAREVAFFFVNPRIVSFDLDDLNHETNEVNLFTMQFDYDFMVMSDQRLLQTPAPEKSLPPSGTAPSEPTPANRSGDSLNDAGSNSPYAQVLEHNLPNPAADLAAAAVGINPRVSAGRNGLGNEMLNTLQQGISRDRLIGISSNINQSFARPSREIVLDADTAGPDSATLSTSTGYVGVQQPDIDLGPGD